MLLMYDPIIKSDKAKGLMLLGTFGMIPILMNLMLDHFYKTQAHIVVGLTSPRN
jgi:hypothetical protein